MVKTRIHSNVYKPRLPRHSSWVRVFDMVRQPSTPKGQAMESKLCKKCGTVKTLDEFYVSKKAKDGHMYRCKECCLNYYLVNRDRIAANKRWPAHKKAMARVDAASRKRHPDRYRARDAVSNAVRDGRLVRQPCEVCGEVKAHGHHDDYSKPLDVRWLCRKHHLEVHGKVAHATE